MSPQQSSLLALVLLIGYQVACTDDDTGELEWQGEHVTVYGHGYSEADVCAGSLTALDQRIGMVMDYFGIESAPHFRFWWVPEDEWEDAGFCPSGGLACATWIRAWSPRLPDMHEATHMITDVFEGDGCPPILNEGLAEYFSDAEFSRSSPTDEFTVEDLIDARYLPPGVGVYARAAHFTAVLLELFGPETMIELCEAIPWRDTVSDWRVALPEITGFTFDEILEYYSEAPNCTSHQLRARLWGCAGTPDFVYIRDDPQRNYFHFDTDCNDQRTTNANFTSIGGAASTRLIYLPVGAWVNIEAKATGPSGKPALFAVQQCASCFDDPVALRSGDPMGPFIEDAYFLMPGFYEVTLFFDPQDRAELTIWR